MNTFLDFADVSNYLTIKLYAWKSGSVISLELQILQNLSTLFWKAFEKFYQGK